MNSYMLISPFESPITQGYYNCYLICQDDLQGCYMVKTPPGAVVRSEKADFGYGGMTNFDKLMYRYPLFWCHHDWNL